MSTSVLTSVNGAGGWPLLGEGGFLGWVHSVFFWRGGVPNGGAQGVTEVDSVFMGIFWLSTVCFVVLMFLMVYWAIKYRRRPGQIALPSPSHNTPLEIAWTVIPLGIMAIMFFKGFHGYMRLAVAPAGAIELDLTAQKWDWTITYPGGENSPEKVLVGDKMAPVFVVPASTPVMLRMKSIDVIHSFWVPDFRGKFDVMPNRYTVYWFNADPPMGGQVLPPGSAAPGEPYEDHWIFCAEYCGDSHSEMTGVIRVVSPEAYAKVIGTWGTAGMTPVELGKRVWTVKCSSCHTSDGKISTGPTWQNLYGHEVSFTDGSTYSAAQMGDPVFFANYVRESILEPSKKIVAGFGNQMVSFQGQIKAEEIEGVIAYIKSISEKGIQEGAGAPAGEVMK